MAGEEQVASTTVMSGFRPGCNCARCYAVSLAGRSPMERIIGRIMHLCPTCGNKRCPRATAHWQPCSGSNDVGQLGSDYGIDPPAELPGSIDLPHFYVETPVGDDALSAATTRAERAEAERAEAERDRLAAIVAQLPQTQDGATIFPGMELWDVSYDGVHRIVVVRIGQFEVSYTDARFPGCPFACDVRVKESRLYSTQAAAVEAERVQVQRVADGLASQSSDTPVVTEAESAASDCPWTPNADVDL